MGKTKEEEKEPLAGVLTVTAIAAKEIQTIQCIGTQDPALRLSTGGADFETQEATNGGTHPKWKKESFEFVLGKSTTQLTMEVINVNMCCDQTIGNAYVPVRDLIKLARKKKASAGTWFDLQPEGKVKLQLKYRPPLTMTVHRATNLKKVQMIGKQDPFCAVRLGAGLPVFGKRQLRTPQHKDSEQESYWEETFSVNLRKDLFEIKDGKSEDAEVGFSVMNENTLFDDLIGAHHVSLAKLKKYVKEKGETKLQLTSENSGKAGNLYVTFKYKKPRG